MVLTLYSAGSNARGQLAHNSEEDSHLFRPCTFADETGGWPDGSKFVSVAAGANHTLLLVSSEGGSLSLSCSSGRLIRLCGLHY